MASKLHQLRSTAVQASELVAKHGCAYYKELLEKNKQHIVHPPTIDKCQELSKQLFYTRLARTELKVEDAGIAALFGLELYAWFCVGEIVGRGFTFTGYYVMKRVDSILV
ncbi:hypothetical protein BHE74_00013199 [Ensete ventricosum]|nr:hypothetical protein BHE74_00013199 [Ensete ventricosum]